MTFLALHHKSLFLQCLYTQLIGFETYLQTCYVETEIDLNPDLLFLQFVMVLNEFLSDEEYKPDATFCLLKCQ